MVIYQFIHLIKHHVHGFTSWNLTMKSFASASGDQGTGRQRQLKVVAGRGKGEGDTLRQRAIWAKWLMNWEIPSEASELVSLLIHPE